jgi:hypothetical protein
MYWYVLSNRTDESSTQQQTNKCAFYGYLPTRHSARALSDIFAYISVQEWECRSQKNYHTSQSEWGCFSIQYRAFSHRFYCMGDSLSRDVKKKCLARINSADGTAETSCCYCEGTAQFRAHLDVNQSAHQHTIQVHPTRSNSSS